MGVSLRALTIGLVVGCVAVVATICTVLSVLSSDRALRDTKASRDASVQRVRDAGEGNVLKVSDDLLNQAAEGTVHSLELFWQQSAELNVGMCRSLRAQGMGSLSWPYLWGRRGQFLAAVQHHSSVLSVTIGTVKSQLIEYYESAYTLDRSPSEYHHFGVSFNNGTDYDPPGFPTHTRTLAADVLPGGLGNPALVNDTSFLGKRYQECTKDLQAQGNGTYFEPPCSYYVEDHRTIVMMFFGLRPVDQVFFSSIVARGHFAGVGSQCDWSDPVSGTRLGLVQIATDLRPLSKFMASMNLGQASGSLGRVYATVRVDPLAPYSTQYGHLVGTSHGESFAKRADLSAVVQPAWNCSDLLVARSAKYLELQHNDSTTNYERIVAQRHPDTITLATARYPAGEVFFLSARVFDNKRGLNWYVVSLIDKEYVLGEVEKVNEQTRRDLHESEDAVDRDLFQARQLLAVVVVACVLIPTGLAVLLVFRVTEPLMSLMHDMSKVAVMNLVSVDERRSLSNLTEVRGMEVSFKQMLKNLVEYRQYLPQSVLYTDTENSETDEDPVRSDQCGSLVSASQSTSLQLGSKEASVRSGTTGMFDTGLCGRSVTILVSNIRNFHSYKDSRGLGSIITRYLEPFVQGAKNFRGIISDVSGDRVTVAFNTLLSVPTHRVKALELGLFIKGACSELNVNMAAATGVATCGNVGCTGLKTYTMVGHVASAVRALERCGRSWELPLLCDGKIASDAALLMYLRALVSAKLVTGAKDTLVHEVVSLKTVCDEEWMYQLQQSQVEDPFHSLNACIHSVYEGELEKAREHLAACDKSLTGIELAYKHLRALMDLGVPPPPLDITACPPL
eukprot:TRINITY_DN612_c0_g2_i1.p1 TRINITY_DN612_c0_g2~~TRINITY_DN612_c0_g2_i1.p1  ORF type:complete len:846 (+),score=284.32 TRINITY_DN612_c0_g2_i1:191-2728(+)